MRLSTISTLLAGFLIGQSAACTPGKYQCARCGWQDDENWYCSDLEVCNTSGNWQRLYDCRSQGFNRWCHQSGDSFWCG
ncbi:hypothetical protein PG990_006628 [Apiospora arundinis]